MLSGMLGDRAQDVLAQSCCLSMRHLITMVTFSKGQFSHMASKRTGMQTFSTKQGCNSMDRLKKWVELASTVLLLC